MQIMELNRACRSTPGCQEDLEKLPPQREAKQAEQLLSSEIAGLERETQFKTAELQGRPACAIIQILQYIFNHIAIDLRHACQQQAHQAPMQS